MILRRVITHVREQNWTAIGIDFLIVVLGVFLGIQLGNWNASRADLRVEDRLLHELRADVEADVAEMDEVVQAVEARIAVMTRILDAAGTPYRGTYREVASEVYGFPEGLVEQRLATAGALAPADTTDPLARLLLLRTLDGNLHSYTAIVNTGSVRLIGDAALARQIQAYYADVDEVQDLERYYFDRNLRLEDHLNAAGLSRGDLQTVDEIARVVAATPSLAAELSDYRYVGFYHWGAILDLQDEARRLADALGTHLGTSSPAQP